MTRVAAIIVLAVAASPQSQIRDVPQTQTGTAVLTGTVLVDEPNGQPIRRALVTATINNDLRNQVQSSTDDRGRFSIGGLPSGNVRLVASKPGYVVTYYGARQPGSTVGRPIALTNDQRVDVTVRLPRGAAISGTITDQTGQPMQGVPVRLQRVTTSAVGQRAFTAVSGAYIPGTDDRGMYRVYGLAAGDYIVTAQPRFPGAVPGSTEVRPTTDAELQWAERQIRAGTAGAAPASTASTPPSQAVGFATVYFPGAVNASLAGIVSVAAGQERSGIDLRMQFIPTARVEGVVTTAGGTPAPRIQVTLIPEAEMASLEAERAMVLMEVGLIAGNMSATSADGAFSIAGVEPGAYTVLARSAAALRPGTGEMLWAMTDIRLDGRDISGLALRLAPGQTVSGRIVLEGAATPPRISIGLRPQGSRGVGVTSPISFAPPDGAFTVPGLIPSPYRLTVTAPGWTLKSASLAGRDVTDVPLEIKPGENLSSLVLTLTDAPSEITGFLYDGAGRPSGDLSIVLFSTNSAMWFPGSRWLRPSVRPATDGRFTFAGLAPGEYYLAALTDVSPADLTSTQFLDQVTASALKVAVAAGEKKTQDIRIK